ncbi:MAG: dTMP kinase [Candidatus Bathyarchaeia archaeon]|nr:dTMP kinase [Candidatus Bathyarchaeota archaeon]
MSKRGLLICIEGLDKSGKTTQSKLLVENLRGMGFEAFYTSEPSDSEIGRFIERYVLRRDRRLPVSAEALLFAADRIVHVEREIRPLLDKGKIVVSDRYIYSSLAYQGAGGLDLKWIMEINRMVPKPDLAIYLDVPVEVIMERIQKGRKRSVMESFEVQVRVREIYLELVREGFLLLIDGNRPIAEVSRELQRIVLERLGLKPTKRDATY